MNGNVAHVALHMNVFFVVFQSFRIEDPVGFAF